MSKPILVYYHTFLVGNFKLLIHEQLLKLFSSGLYDACKNVYIGISSPDNNNTNWVLDLIKDYDKIVPLVYEENHAEKSTLRYLMDMATKGDYYFYYYMTKNVATNTGVKSNITHEQIIKNELWRVHMEYNTINKWKECVSYLNEGYDAVGCNFRKDTHVGFHPHFSGNFWWSKSDHINSLNHTYLYDEQMLGGANALLAEFWIGSNYEANLKEVFDCGTVAPYTKEITFKEYINPL